MLPLFGGNGSEATTTWVALECLFGGGFGVRVPGNSSVGSFAASDVSLTLLLFRSECHQRIHPTRSSGGQVAGGQRCQA